MKVNIMTEIMDYNLFLPFFLLVSKEILLFTQTHAYLSIHEIHISNYLNIILPEYFNQYIFTYIQTYSYKYKKCNNANLSTFVEKT